MEIKTFELKKAEFTRDFMKEGSAVSTPFPPSGESNFETKQFYGADYDEKIRMTVANGEMTELHYHNFLELAYVAEGSALHFCDNRVETINSGDYFIIDYNVRHGYIALPEVKGLTIVNCLFLPSFIDKTMGKRLPFNSVLSNYLIRFGSKNYISKIGDFLFHDDDGRIRRLLDGMLEEYYCKKSGYLEILRCNLIEMIVQTMRKATTPEKEAFGDSVSQIKNYVDEHYMKQITLTDISSNLNFSLPYLSKKFKNETGCLFSDYLQKIRVEQACRLLANTDKKIIDISQLVGYDDIKFFGVVFKKYMHMSPMAYRRLTKLDV